MVLYVLSKVVRGDREHDGLIRRSQKFDESPEMRHMIRFCHLPFPFESAQVREHELQVKVVLLVQLRHVLLPEQVGVMDRCPREMSRGELGRIFVPCSVLGLFVTDPPIVCGEDGTYVRLSNLASSSSLRNCTSSKISSSDHLRVARFFTNGRSWATNIAGRLADGAFVTRF